MDQNLYNVYCALNNLNDTLRQMHGPLESNNELLIEQKEPLKLLTTFVGRLNGTMMRIEKQLEQLAISGKQAASSQEKVLVFIEGREKKGM